MLTFIGGLLVLGVGSILLAGLAVGAVLAILAAPINLISKLLKGN